MEPSMKQRRVDGTFGVEGKASKNAGNARGAGRPFVKGDPRAGRPKGRKNRIKAEMAALLAKRPGYAEGDLPPEDDLECLQWIKRHPLASLDLVCHAATQRAKFFHRILRDDKVTHNLPDGFAEMVSEVRERFIKAHQEASTQTNTPTVERQQQPKPEPEPAATGDADFSKM